VSGRIASFFAHDSAAPARNRWIPAVYSGRSAEPVSLSSAAWGSMPTRDRGNGDQNPLAKRLNSGPVICCADAIPGVREEVVLRAVIEFISRTQLPSDVETQSGNTQSNRSPANNPHCRPFFLGGRDFRRLAGMLKPENSVTIHVHHAEIIAQLGSNYVVTAGDTKGLFHLLNLMQQCDLSCRWKETGFNRICR
jgi:hypothetical protein